MIGVTRLSLGVTARYSGFIGVLDVGQRVAETAVKTHRNGAMMGMAILPEIVPVIWVTAGFARLDMIDIGGAILTALDGTHRMGGEKRPACLSPLLRPIEAAVVAQSSHRRKRSRIAFNQRRQVGTGGLGSGGLLSCSRVMRDVMATDWAPRFDTSKIFSM